MLNFKQLLDRVQGMGLKSEDLALLTSTLVEYRDVMEYAYSIVDEKCQDVVDFMEEHSLEDSEEDRLTDDEYSAWVNMAKILDCDYPLPEWYDEMWPGNSDPTEE